MVTLEIKNIKEVEDNLVEDVKALCSDKLEFYNNLFKNYNKDLDLIVIIDKSSALYKTSASLNMESKKILLVKENKDVLKALRALFADFKKTVKKQYELEKKDYLYKRKR